MANIRRMTRQRLGELLLHEGLVNDEQLTSCLAEQKETGEPIGEILVRKGYVTESDIARTICTQFSFPYLSVSHYYIAPEMLSLFPFEALERHLFVPIDRFGDVLAIVTAGLLNQDLVDEMEKDTRCTLQVYVGTVSEVKQVIKEKFLGGTGSKAAPGAAQAQVKPDDVTAPPKSRAADATSAHPAGTTRLSGDDAVVHELEEQFKKFRLPSADDKPGDTPRN